MTFSTKHTNQLVCAAVVLDFEDEELTVGVGMGTEPRY